MVRRPSAGRLRQGEAKPFKPLELFVDDSASASSSTSMGSTSSLGAGFGRPKGGGSVSALCRDLSNMTTEASALGGSCLRNLGVATPAASVKRSRKASFANLTIKIPPSLGGRAAAHLETRLRAREVSCRGRASDEDVGVLHSHEHICLPYAPVWGVMSTPQPPRDPVGGDRHL